MVDCPENFTYRATVNGCYYVVNDQMHAHLANQRCISLHPNSHLVVINSDAEQTAVSDLLYEYPGEYTVRHSNRQSIRCFSCQKYRRHNIEIMADEKIIGLEPNCWRNLNRDNPAAACPNEPKFDMHMGLSRLRIVKFVGWCSMGLVIKARTNAWRWEAFKLQCIAIIGVARGCTERNLQGKVINAPQVQPGRENPCTSGGLNNCICSNCCEGNIN